jgi:hypothetical protein
LDERARALIAAQVQGEKVWAFIRSYYRAKETGDAQGFVSHFAVSPRTVYQDATLGFGETGYATIAGTVTDLNAIFGVGRFSKVFHVTGDLRYGRIAEHVDLQNTFYATNGITIQTVFDLMVGLLLAIRTIGIHENLVGQISPVPPPLPA